MKRIIIGVGVAIVGMASAAVALAASPSAVLQGYAGVGGQIQTKVSSPAAHGVLGVGTLPFTGLGLALIAIAATLLMVTGFALRRVSRKQQP
jgi:hypothetical protein